MFNKNKKTNTNIKNRLAVLAASLLLTFSGGICTFAGENAYADSSSGSDTDTTAAATSSTDTSFIIEETAHIKETAHTEDAAETEDTTGTEDTTETEDTTGTEDTSETEDTTETDSSNDTADDHDNPDSTNSEAASHVIIAGSSAVGSGQRTQTDTDRSGSGTDTEDSTGSASGENAGDASAEVRSDDVIDGLISLGVFRTTAYCPCYACSEGYGRHTCTGATARSGHTIAVDPRVIPFGSKVLINGVVYTAEDRGGAVRGNHIDIFFDSHAQTWQYGTRNAEVFLLA